MKTSIYDFKVKDIDGKEISLSDYKNKVLLIVNTASKCGFTRQYAGLEALYKKYKDQGLEILAFPCNQFGKQEPGDSEAIKNFCSTTYGVTFKLAAKIEVNGINADNLYKYLKKQKRGFLGFSTIKWNFTKFLINKQGKVVKRFAPFVKPDNLNRYIENLLNRK